MTHFFYHSTLHVPKVLHLLTTLRLLLVPSSQDIIKYMSHYYCLWGWCNRNAFSVRFSWNSGCTISINFPCLWTTLRMMPTMLNSILKLCVTFHHFHHQNNIYVFWMLIEFMLTVILTAISIFITSKYFFFINSIFDSHPILAHCY